MTPLRQWLYGFALLGALSLLLWGQYQRNQAEQARTELATQQLQKAQERIERQATAITRINQALQAERAAQADLRTTQNQLRSGLAKRNKQIEELKRENTELRDWAAQQLPDAARRLRERPALTGAAAYRDWLPSRGAVPVAGQPPEQ